MAITETVTERVKDVFAISKSIVKVVKEEVEIYMESKNDEDYDEADYETADTKSYKEYFESFETKARELIDNAFAGFKTSKKEEQTELEARIVALEEKLNKLVEDSLEALRNEI